MKKAFSLIELMIVIVIIGVVYTLAVTKLQDVGEKKVVPSFANLQEYLYSFIKEDNQRARLVCLDDCSECSVEVDGAKVKSLESFFDSSVEVYRYDALSGMVSQEQDAYFNSEGSQESLCFGFEIDKQKISDQVIVVYKDRVYDYSAYFGEQLVYDSLSALTDVKENNRQKVMQ